MNGVIIVTVAFSVLIFLIVQIRLIRRYIKLKRSYSNLPGVLFLAEAIGEGCFLCFDCCLWASGDSEKVDVLGGEHLEKYSGKPPEEHEIKKALERKEKAGEVHPTGVEEQNKVKELLSKRQKTSILYLSNITSLPKQSIVEIILADPDYIIEHEYVINKKVQPIKVTTKGVCPVCDTSLESGWEFCPNCGYVLK